MATVAFSTKKIILGQLRKVVAVGKEDLANSETKTHAAS
jgi:hypothetical protein